MKEITIRIPDKVFKKLKRHVFARALASNLSLADSFVGILISKVEENLEIWEVKSKEG